MEQPLVSIVTITRNRAEIIERCINSVLKQSYKNIEHIVVDGASTDNTTEVCERYVMSDERFHYFRLTDNLPIPETINYGVNQSRGEYICFLDDDDEYHINKVQRQIELFQNLSQDYGMVYCWMTYFDNETKKVIRNHTPSLRGNVMPQALSKPIITGTPTYCVKRRVFIESGGWKSIGIISDWEFALRICRNWKVDYVPESLVNVYENHSFVRMSDSTYYKNSIKRHIDFFGYIESEYSEFFAKYPKTKDYVRQMLFRLHLRNHDYKKAFLYYKEILQVTPSLKNIFLYPTHYIKTFFS